MPFFKVSSEFVRTTDKLTKSSTPGSPLIVPPVIALKHLVFQTCNLRVDIGIITVKYTARNCFTGFLTPRKLLPTRAVGMRDTILGTVLLPAGLNRRSVLGSCS